ncbi:hypothetical protein M422DRAFT_239480 [Sphaerobolus stellatus SS14]|nr:hypothetical protein M422DRAFT_239480 [Sphaerobolus stellatus SS14]
MTSEVLSLQRSFFIGQHLESIAYGELPNHHILPLKATQSSFYLIGINLAIFTIVIYFMIFKKPTGTASDITPWGFLFYLFLLLITSSINAAAGIRFAQLAWIEHQDSPIQFFNENLNTNSVQILGNTSYILAAILAGGLLLWRCSIFYRGMRWLLCLISLGFMATTVLSLVALYESTRPSSTASRFAPTFMNTVIPSWSLSLVSNLVLSLLIVARLLWHRRNLSKAFGSGTSHATPYSNLAAIFIESAALYVVTSLIHLIMFSRGNDAHFLIFGTLVQVEVMAPQLILLRIALGRSSEPLSEQRFSTHLSFARPTVQSMESVQEAQVAYDTQAINSESFKGTLDIY